MDEAEREARNERSRRWREDNPEYSRRWREAHLEAERARDRLRYEGRREAVLETARRWREANREAKRERDRFRREAVRAIVFAYYCPHSPPCCACCGTAEDLTIDHVDGDGTAHRIELFGDREAGGWRFYQWLIAENFPDEPALQVLCMACNRSKGDGSRCGLSHALTSYIA